MELSEMNLDQVNARLTQLDAEVREMTEVDAVKAATEEKKNLLARKAELAEIETRKADAEKLAGDKAAPDKVQERGGEMPEREVEIRNTQKYINAYAEYIKTGDDKQCRALLTVNAESDGQLPVPTLVEDMIRTAWDREGIMSRVKKTYLKGNLQIGFETSADGAVIHKEGDTAPTQENLVLGIVTLIPQSIKKWITISDEAMDMNGQAFLEYVYNELTYRIAKKAADTLIADIVSHTTTGSTTSPAIGQIKATQVSVGLVAQALGELTDEAPNPTIMMNKATWSAFKKAQYDNNFSVDPFEGLPVAFNDTIKAFSVATTGETYMIVGDLGNGAQANFPNGEEIKFTFDDKSLAEADLIKIVGREYVGLGVVAPKQFVKVVK